MGNKIKWESFKEPGGDEYDEAECNRGKLRAELIQLASQISFQHAPKIVDAILENYEVTER